MDDGFIETSDANAIKYGMSEEEVESRLGPPAAVLTPDSVNTPTEQIGWLGSKMFQFDDDDLECVWTYKHRVRTKLTFLFGLRAGRVVVIWRETATD